MNTNGKLADIWLIYRCIGCDSTHNLPVVERTPVTRIKRPLFEAATVNDAVVARRLARDATLLRRAGTRFARGDEFRTAVAGLKGSRIDVTFEEPLVVRLDEVLSMATGIPRSRLRALERSKQLVLEPRRALTRSGLTGNTTVTLRSF